MLSIEIKVNGNPVATITGYRSEERYDKSGKRLCDYHYGYSVFPLGHNKTPVSGSGNIRGHEFNDGIVTLSKEILASIERINT